MILLFCIFTHILECRRLQNEDNLSLWRMFQLLSVICVLLCLCGRGGRGMVMLV
jgi:hypothetical protein